MSILGIHHITALSGEPQRNVDFYAGLLGLRLVKVTVNQDDPGTYHLYYGDGAGTPGSILTFFPWPQAFHGRNGVFAVGATAFTVRPGSLDFWEERLIKAEVPTMRSVRFGENVLHLTDPDGLNIELIESTPDPRFVSHVSDVPAEYALLGFHSATEWLKNLPQPEAFLTERWGYRRVGEEDGRVRLAVQEGLPHQLIDLTAPNLEATKTGPGAVHHIAFRVADAEQELQARNEALAFGLQPTEPIDRFYFKSVYFRSPGSVLYEIATDGPGWTVDEAPDALAHKLVLPPWLEEHRPQIELRLPKIRTPHGVTLP